MHKSRSHATGLQALCCYWVLAADPSWPSCALRPGVMAHVRVWQCGSDAVHELFPCEAGNSMTAFLPGMREATPDGEREMVD
jgi:hypothetical protein